MSDTVNVITTYDAGATKLNPFFMTLTAVGGSVNLLVVLMHWLSPNIRRPAAFVNFFASLVVWAASYGLLLFGFPNDPNPPFGLCVVQAAAIYGNLIMLGTGYFVLQITFWAILRSTTYLPTAGVLTRAARVGGIVLPYLAWLIVATNRLMEGLRNRDHTLRAPHGFYCTIQDNNKFGNIIRLVSGSFGFAGLVFQVLSIRLFRRSKDTTSGTTPERKQAMKSLLVRVGVLTGYAVICVCLSIIDVITTKATLVTDQLLASIPLVCGLLVITQKDYRRIIGSIFECLIPVWTRISILRRRQTPPPMSRLDMATFPSGGAIHISSQQILSCDGIRSNTPASSQMKDHDVQSDDDCMEPEEKVSHQYV